MLTRPWRVRHSIRVNWDSISAPSIALLEIVVLAITNRLPCWSSTGDDQGLHEDRRHRETGNPASDRRGSGPDETNEDSHTSVREVAYR